MQVENSVRTEKKPCQIYVSTTGKKAETRETETKGDTHREPERQRERWGKGEKEKDLLVSLFRLNWEVKFHAQESKE